MKMGYLEFIRMTREEFRGNLYAALIATTQSPIVIQEQIKIAEAFVFLDIMVSYERLDEMDETIKAVCDNTLAGEQVAKTRQDLLRAVINDPTRHQFRTYKNQITNYAQNNKRDPMNVLFEDLFLMLGVNHSL